MRVLITRPREDASALARRLAGLGVDTLIEPMFDIVHRSTGAPDLHGVQAILLTSANGARALAALSAERRVPILAVGDATARTARELGFAAVESADGDVESLARLAVERLDPGAGRVVHVAGTAVAGDLAGELAAGGFDVQRAVLYETRPRRSLSPETVAALRDGMVDGVLFFSPRTGTTFVRVAGEAGLTDACRGLVAFCLSQAVADAVKSLSWRAVTVAAQPTQDALLAAVKASTGAADRFSAQREKDPDMSDDGKSEDRPMGADDGPPSPAVPATGKSAAEIVQRFGGIRPMANKLGIAVTTVQGWKERGVIPAARHEQVVAAARDHGIALEAADLAAPAAGEPATPQALPPTMMSSSASAPPQQPAASEPKSAIPPPSPAPTGGSAPKAPDPARPTPRDPAAPDRTKGSVPPASTAPKKRSGVSPVFALVVIGVLVAGGGYLWWQWNLSGETAPTAAAPDERADDQAAATDDDTANQDVASTTPSAPPSGADSVPVTAPVQPAGSSAPESSDRPALVAPTGIDEAALSAALASRDAEIAALRTEAARTASALQAATTRLAAVERKTAERPPASVSSGDPRAAGLVLAVGLLREALRGPDAFAAELETLKTLAADDPEITAALAPIEARAAAGVPTMGQLQSRFADVATAILRAGSLPADPGWMDRVTHRIATLVSVRRTGPGVAGDTTEARIARAEAAMTDGNLRATVEIMAGLEGAAAAAAEDWLADARARLAAADAMRRLQSLAVGRLSPSSAEPPGAGAKPDAAGE